MNDDSIVVPELEIVIATENSVRTVRAGDRIPRDFRALEVRFVGGPAIVSRQQQPAQAATRLVEIRGTPMGLGVCLIALSGLIWARFGWVGVLCLGCLVGVLRTIAHNTRAEWERRQLAKAPRPMV
jgi:hypothetical protein